MDLTGDWALWRDFAVRSTGFPVEGLGVFGAPDESERLAEVARSPAFREAIAWQSRMSLASAVDKHASGRRESPARVRRREEVIASYWQRYCSKNDTIGFFGPLGWGRFSGNGFAARGGSPEHERIVHFENWAVEAVGAAAGVPPLVPMDPFPERALRARLEAEAPAELARLDRLEAARRAVAAADREQLAGALDELDRTFEEVTGRPAARADGDSGGGRTIAYLDCMRDLDLAVGGEVLAELRATLPAVLEASRWWCGRVFAAGDELLRRVAHGRDGPSSPASPPPRSSPTPRRPGAGRPITRPTSRSPRPTPTPFAAATSSSCSATSTAATTRSPRAFSPTATRRTAPCSRASPARSGRACTCCRRAAASSR